MNTNGRILPDLSATARLEAQIAALSAKLAAAQAKAAAKAQPRPFTVKAQTSQAGRVYMVLDTGVGRPVALYKAQWDAIVNGDNQLAVEEFCADHPELS
jgi:hypothetical protein